VASQNEQIAGCCALFVVLRRKSVYLNGVSKLIWVFCDMTSNRTLSISALKKTLAEFDWQPAPDGDNASVMLKEVHGKESELFAIGERISTCTGNDSDVGSSRRDMLSPLYSTENMTPPLENER
jgi:hypothetical protein